MEGVLNVIIKLTTGDMRNIASTGHSQADDFSNVYNQVANLADDLAMSGMQGMAGPALAAKAAELRQQVHQHSETAKEKFLAVSGFADRTDEAEHERQSRIFSIQSL